MNFFTTLHSYSYYLKIYFFLFFNRPEQRPPTNLGSSSTAGSQLGGNGGGRLGTSSSSTSNDVGSGMSVGPSMLLFAHIHADILRPDVYRSFHRDERNAINKFYIPKRDNNASNASNSTQLDFNNPEEAVTEIGTGNVTKDLAREVMAQLVEDLMDDPFVQHLVEDMPPAKTPFFVQLAKEGVTEYGNLSANVGASGEKKEDGSSTKEDVFDGERSPMTENDKNILLKTSETQDLLSKIMENTMFNLISEVAHGEINLNVEPRRMVIPNKTSSD